MWVAVADLSIKGFSSLLPSRAMHSLVSILIPAFNAEKFIADTLRSALSQTWPNTEIIVVNDGSKDNTLAVAKAFQSPTVKVISQENRGQCPANNRAFSECQGDFIQYLDADDLISPNKIEVQLRRLADCQPGCVASCAWGRFHDSPATARFIPYPTWADMSPVEWLVCSWTPGGGLMPNSGWLLPRDVVVEAGPWDDTISLLNDFDFFCRALLAGSGVRFCPGPKAYYRSGIPSSLSQTRPPKAWDSAFRAIQAGTTRLLIAEDSARTRRACADAYQHFVYDAYLDCPDLAKRAQIRVQELGGSNMRCGGGKVFRILAPFFGWKIGRRAQTWASGLRRSFLRMR